jgi:hypothetical protein
MPTLRIAELAGPPGAGYQVTRQTSCAVRAPL